MKVTIKHISLLAFFSESDLVVNALPMIEVEGAASYCYGYGQVYGAPDKLMKDDMERIEEDGIG